MYHMSSSCLWDDMGNKGLQKGARVTRIEMLNEILIKVMIKMFYYTHALDNVYSGEGIS